jgi:glutathione S-transferase
MKLYFNPLACSLGSRIAAYEAGIALDYVQVNGKTKRASDGSDFRTINPLGLVPALLLDDGSVLTENAAVLQYLARTPSTSRLHQWLCFIGTELHKALYVPLLDPKAPEGAKAYALSKAESRLSWLAGQLEGRDTLLDRFSVADAYLVTVLNWSLAVPVKLDPWPSITSYVARVRRRPSVARAFEEEIELYKQELARHR